MSPRKPKSKSTLFPDCLCTSTLGPSQVICLLSQQCQFALWKLSGLRPEPTLQSAVKAEASVGQALRRTMGEDKREGRKWTGKAHELDC